jgi:hypothetical protein
MLYRLLATAAWTPLAVLVFVTILPSETRPIDTENPNIERFGAFSQLSGNFLALPTQG